MRPRGSISDSNLKTERRFFFNPDLVCCLSEQSIGKGEAQKAFHGENYNDEAGDDGHGKRYLETALQVIDKYCEVCFACFGQMAHMKSGCTEICRVAG